MSMKLSATVIEYAVLHDALYNYKSKDKEKMDAKYRLLGQLINENIPTI